MTLERRIDAVEDNLSPREAVIRWMREAHEFGSLGAYGRWLLDQPDDAYPLVRMPRQVVGAVRAPNKGVPDAKLRPDFYRVQKEVTFLYLLHEKAEERALMDNEAINLRVIMLIKEIRALIKEKHALDQVRLDRVNLGEGRHPRPGKAERTMRDGYEKHAASWLPLAETILVRILEFLGAAKLISGRYFAGEDILYPATRENLKLGLETIANMREIYDDTICGAPQTDDEFRDYLLAMVEPGREPRNQAATSRVRKDLPDVSKGARVLAEQWILMARSETLEKLGEHREAEALADQLARQVLGP